MVNQKDLDDLYGVELGVSGKNRYYIVSVENCVRGLKEFLCKYDALEYLHKFSEQYGSLDDNAEEGNWIECVFVGQKLDIKTKYSLVPTIGGNDER